MLTRKIEDIKIKSGRTPCVNFDSIAKELKQVPEGEALFVEVPKDLDKEDFRRRLRQALVVVRKVCIGTSYHSVWDPDAQGFWVFISED